MNYGRAYEEMERRVKSGSLTMLAQFLSIWDTAALHPVVLWTEVQDIPVEQKDAVYSLLESYLVRRDLCDLGNQNYNKVAAGALKVMHAASDPADALFRYMTGLTGEASRLPTNSELVQAVLREPVYKEMGSKKLRYVLSRIEKELRDRFDEDVTVATDNLTVEHIMPRHWSKHWPLPSGNSVSSEDPFLLSLSDEEVSDDLRREMETRQTAKDTLGNLTMITTSLNPSLSNGPWSEKRLAIGKSLLVLNRQVAQHEIWDESGIEARGSKLATVVNTIWTYPPTMLATISSV
jgi:hypothetical protein